MKRRHFLSAALISLLANPASAKKKSGTVTKDLPHHPISSPKKYKKSQGHPKKNPALEHPLQGTSASRLPPVKAAELPHEWQHYEVTLDFKCSREAFEKPFGLWLPLPSAHERIYQRTISQYFQGSMDFSILHRLPDDNLEAFYAKFSPRKEASLQMVLVLATADRSFGIGRRTVAPERDDILQHNLQETSLIPNEGRIRELGIQIIGRIKDPVAQAKAIYDWVTDHALYHAALVGCGTGDVREQINTAQYGGRSADISALFVALCRSVGIPARPVYGLRVGPSHLFESLGIKQETATDAQHVRAEFYVPGYGWIPVDPSDVCRAADIENLSKQDNRYKSLQRTLFGFWEMNWVVFNLGQDINLPEPSAQSKLPFFIQPLIDTGSALQEAWQDSPRRYTIKSRKFVR